MSLAFPDTCNVMTPAGPVPTPFPNIAMSSLAIPNILNHFITAMPVHNLGTVTPLSSGNEASAPLGGVVSARFIGPQRNLLGSGSMRSVVGSSAVLPGWQFYRQI